MSSLWMKSEPRPTDFIKDKGCSSHISCRIPVKNQRPLLKPLTWAKEKQNWTVV